MFQWAPTLGGECYALGGMMITQPLWLLRFNGHPPLGVNATSVVRDSNGRLSAVPFQRAPTLGGECYLHAPFPFHAGARVVSMGTHPWG